MRQEAPAKINLYLEVRGLRPDGYHEVATVLQELQLSDTIEVVESDALTLQASGLPIPEGSENLVLKAARLLAEGAGVRRGAAFRLEKRVPPGSGMGGGSSDAAAALTLLNRLWDLRASREDLARVGARVGSDVPFFLWGGTALCTGRGEKVEPLRRLGPLPLRILWSGKGLSTAEVYLGLLPEEKIAPPGGLASFLRVLEEKGEHEPWSVVDSVYNALQGSALRRMPELSVMTGKAHMTGSGSAFFTRHAFQAQKSWKEWASST